MDAYALLADPVIFARAGGVMLRAYQVEVARAVVDSVLHGRGRSFAVMFPRQSGKNELQAQIEAYLLYLLQFKDADLIKISPTWAPQSLNAMRRLERVLSAHPWTRALWKKESGTIYRIGRARITFLSGAPGSNIVGATASHLLEVDEAQDVAIAKYDKDAAPMASSTNATRVFWGTAWTAQTLLARELRSARAAAAADAVAEAAGGPTRLAFTLTAEQVAREVPSYGAFVAGQVARLGRAHPMVRTQYYSEEIEGQGGMFPEERVARMLSGDPLSTLGAGTHPPVAFLLDVAGEEEAAVDRAPVDLAAGDNPRRDATALTVVRVAHDPLLRAPVYSVLERRAWVGVKHTHLYGEIRALAERLRPRWLVVDATGVGAGLASFLARALPGKVIPFLFTAQSKSKLGWDFLEIVDSGRWHEPQEWLQPQEQDQLHAQFLRQLRFCTYSIQPGPGRLMRWGVPDGARDPATGEYVHDDLLLSAALSAVLEELDWQPRAGADPGLVRARDPLEGMDRF